MYGPKLVCKQEDKDAFIKEHVWSIVWGEGGRGKAFNQTNK